MTTEERGVLLGSAELERLRAAEALAVVFGWCGVNTEGPREKVAFEFWRKWAAVAGSDFTGPKAHPDLNARVKEAERDARRRRRAA